MILRILSATLAVAFPCAWAQTFTHFEARHVHPISLTPDGKTLLAVNSPDASLSVFDCSNSLRQSPLLIGEIPVGLEPVSVRARTDSEAWGVNEVSDSISVVSLIDGSVMDTLQVPDEPADVHFAAGKAFVSCSANRMLRVFNATTRAPLGSISLEGVAPRAITSNADGSRLYVAFLLSGNRTTILPRTTAPAQPVPDNPNLPAAPTTALIVAANDPRIAHNVIDHDVAEINTSALAVTRYFGGTGTHPFDLTLRPGSDELWIANSESLNLIRYEPNLRGKFARHRLSKIQLNGDATPLIHDLNPGIDYEVMPNTAASSQALAQPTAIVFPASGQDAWIAAFNSDRVARVDVQSGAVSARIDLRSEGEGSALMRGPRGLALTPDGTRLFVLNKISNSITTIDTGTAAVLTEIPAGSNDPTPAAIRQGRGFLFDARLSGNGTVSCATCHLDADRDGLAWDQGDPGGEMVTMKGAFLSAHILTLEDRVMHPMKGPMVTKTLVGMGGNVTPLVTPPEAITAKFHWRGDKPSLQSFNSTYDKLMGGSEIPAADMDALSAYLMTLRHHPNPNRNPDRTLPTALGNGNPVKGRDMFNNHEKSHCAMCHALPAGTDQNIDRKLEVNGTQEMKNPPLRTIYQRANLYNPASGAASLSGFGLGSDGSGHEMPKVHFYQLDNLSKVQELRDVSSFLMCFDTGTAPAVGRSMTIDHARKGSAVVTAEMDLLEARAAPLILDCDVVLRGKIGGVSRSYRYVPTSARYVSDRADEAPLTRAALLALIQPGDSATLLGVLQGNGARLGGDRDGNGVSDGNEAAPVLTISPAADGVILKWPGPSSGWYPQSSPNPAGPWVPMTAPSQFLPDEESSALPTSVEPRRFFRLHSTR
jgi:YVTN family beta-propeller protein